MFSLALSSGVGTSQAAGGVASLQRVNCVDSKSFAGGKTRNVFKIRRPVQKSFKPFNRCAPFKPFRLILMPVPIVPMVSTGSRRLNLELVQRFKVQKFKVILRPSVKNEDCHLRSSILDGARDLAVGQLNSSAGGSFLPARGGNFRGE